MVIEGVQCGKELMTDVDNDLALMAGRTLAIGRQFFCVTCSANTRGVNQAMGAIELASVCALEESVKR